MKGSDHLIAPPAFSAFTGRRGRAERWLLGGGLLGLVVLWLGATGAVQTIVADHVPAGSATDPRAPTPDAVYLCVAESGSHARRWSAAAPADDGPSSGAAAEPRSGGPALE